jgi:predicted nucleotidyltransferase
MEALQKRLRAVVDAHPDVRLAYVFGSAARGDLRADSDLDVAVRFAVRPTLERLAALTDDLQRAAGRSADVVDLDAAQPLLLREVVKEGRLLFAASDEERISFETGALARYADTAYLRRVQAEYLHAWAEAHRAGAG